MPLAHEPRRTRFARTLEQIPSTIPFVAPEALERMHGVPLRLRLGANESAFGPSPAAIAAMRDAAAQTHLYGDPESHELRSALAIHVGVNAQNLVVGNGIDGLLGYMVRAFIEAGDNVVTSRGTYPTFNYHVIAHGGILHKVPYREDRANLAMLLDTARSTNARLVYLANPDNPSGSWHTGPSIVDFAGILPQECTLVLDEAYHEFAPAAVVPSFPANQHNVVRLRTFSKAHGMAGARIGYGIADPELIGMIEKFRNQFEVSRVSQAGALASLADRTFVQGVIGEVAKGRRDYEQLAIDVNLEYIPSATNFVCIDVGGRERSIKVLHELLRRGVFIRMPGEPPLDRCVRVTVGSVSDRAGFAEEFRDVLKHL